VTSQKNHQNNCLKAIIAFANFLENTTFYDVKNKGQVLEFLSTKNGYWKSGFFHICITYPNIEELVEKYYLYANCCMTASIATATATIVKGKY
jgi:hypothetical protein